MRAEVYYPAAASDPSPTPAPAAGRFPLVVFVHGAHMTCYDPSSGADTMQWPCSAGWSPIPSYRGFDYLGKSLASHGYIAVSISANALSVALTDDPPTRANLIESHLELWSQLNATGSSYPAPFTSGFIDKVDLSNVGTIGLSRGADAVVTHAKLFPATAARRVRAVLPIAPPYQFNGFGNVPLGILLGYCDADVPLLYGGKMFDDARYDPSAEQAPRYLFTSLGANHNYFNTVWTPECWTSGGCWTDARGTTPASTGDDWVASGSEPRRFGDPHCDASVSGNGRLTAAQQRAVALTYTTAFFRYHLGGESQFGPLLRGDTPPPAGLDQKTFVTYQPPAPQRLDLNRFSSSGEVTTTDTLNGAVSFEAPILAPTPSLCSGGACLSTAARQPHPTLSRARVRWVSPVTTYTHGLPAGKRDVHTFTTLQFRAAVDFSQSNAPTGSPYVFSVGLSDGVHTVMASTNQQLGNNDLYYPPPGYSQAGFMNTVRLPLSLFSGVDLNNVQDVRFRFDGTANAGVILSDLAFANDNAAPAATCTDGIQNGSETGVDCGGATCPACPPPPTTSAGFVLVTQLSGSMSGSSATSLNSSGGTNQITWLTPGWAQVDFPGLGGSSGGNVQVTAFGSTGGRCKVQSFGSSGTTLQVLVRCHSFAGVATSLPFAVSYLLRTGSPGVEGGYAWADQPTFSQYTPASSYQWNSTGSAVTIQRSSTGVYTVTFPGQTFSGGTAQVTAYGAGSEYCKVASWGAPTVAVRCFTSSGAAADTRFTVRFTSGSPQGTASFGYAWADNVNSNNYQPASTYQLTSLGTQCGGSLVRGPVNITRSSTGRYRVTFTGLSSSSPAKTHVKVTGYGTDNTTCRVVSWTTGANPTADVACDSASGSPVNARYTITYSSTAIGPC